MGCFDKKLQNTFKFRSFAEQLAEISVDISRQVALCRSSTPSDSDTFFHAGLLKWSDLNFTEHYSNFLSELGSDIQSFAQLLLKKEYVIDTVLKHLAVPDTMALQPLLELLVALARDLRDDFCPVFVHRCVPLFYRRLLRTAQPQRLGWLFACLAHLYKLLWRPLVANLSATIDMYAAMLAPADGGTVAKLMSQHTVRFLAESFAFVCRKCGDQLALFTLVYSRLATNDKLCELVARLVFECVRGVRGRLHVHTESVLRAHLTLLATHDTSATSTASAGAVVAPPVAPQRVCHCLGLALKTAAAHVQDRQHAQPLWTPLWETVLSDQCSAAVFTAVCSFLLQLLQYRSASLVRQPADSFVANCCQLLRQAAQTGSEAGAEAALAVVAAAINGQHSGLSEQNIVCLHEQALSVSLPARSVLTRYSRQLIGHPLFDTHLLPPLLLYIHNLPATAAAAATAPSAAAPRAELAQTVLNLLSHCILHKQPIELVAALDNNCPTTTSTTSSSSGGGRWCDKQQQQQDTGDIFPLDFNFAIHTRSQSCPVDSNTGGAVKHHHHHHHQQLLPPAASSWLCDYVTSHLRQLDTSTTSATTYTSSSSISEANSSREANRLPTLVGSQLAQMALVAAHLRPVHHATIVAAVAARWHCVWRQIVCNQQWTTVDRTAPGPSNDMDCVSEASRIVSRVQLLPPSVPDSTQFSLLNQLLLLTAALQRLQVTAAAAAVDTQQLPSWSQLLKLFKQSAKATNQLQLLWCFEQLLRTAAAAAAGDGGCDIVDKTAFCDIYNTLAHNLASPYHKIRLLTLNILCLCAAMSDSCATVVDSTTTTRVDSNAHSALSTHSAAAADSATGATAAAADTVPSAVLEVCRSAESQPVSVLTARHRQLLLERLDVTLVGHQLSHRYLMTPVLYLLGSLHVPFSTLWPVCQDLLADHCSHLLSSSADQLTHLWRTVLTMAATAAQSAHTTDARADFLSSTSDQLCPAEQFVYDHLLSLTSDRVDLCNYRLLLWRLTDKMAATLPPSAVDTLAALFIRFVEDEVFAGDLSFAPWQDLTSSSSCTVAAADPHSVSSSSSCSSSATPSSSSLSQRPLASDTSSSDTLCHSVTMSSGSTSGGGSAGVQQQQQRQQTRGRGGRGSGVTPSEQTAVDACDNSETAAAASTRRAANSGTTVVRNRGVVEVLCAHLTTMARLTQMRRSQYSAQLCQLFTRFLSHKRTDVQRAALHCLLAYKVKSLHLYSDLLFSLLDDANFKTRLTSISVSEQAESPDIQPEHRQHILPLLNRILYGRMRSSTGAGASSRDNAARRRQLVASFISSYSPSEIGHFLQLCLDLFDHLPITDTSVESDGGSGGSLSAVARAVAARTCLSRAVPLARLQCAALLLTTIVARLGRLLAPCLAEAVLPRLVALCAHVERLLALAGGQQQSGDNTTTPTPASSATTATLASSAIASVHVRTLKKIRAMMVRCLRELFDRFADYSGWSGDQLSTLFRVCIRPALATLVKVSPATAATPATAANSRGGGGGGGGGASGESTDSVTCVLRLLLTWTKFERYIPLLLWRLDCSPSATATATCQSGRESQSVSWCDGQSVVGSDKRAVQSNSTVISLLVGLLQVNCHRPLCGANAAIMRALETMLAPPPPVKQNRDGGEGGSVCHPLYPPGYPALPNVNKVGVGSAVLLTVLPALLDYLLCRVQQLSPSASSSSSASTSKLTPAAKNSCRRQLTNCELSVLARVCSLGASVCTDQSAGDVITPTPTPLVAPSAGDTANCVSQSVSGAVRPAYLAVSAQRMAAVLIAVLVGDKQLQTAAAAEQRQLPLLHVLYQLLTVASEPHKLIRPMVPLLSQLPTAEAHHQLTSCFQLLLSTFPSSHPQPSPRHQQSTVAELSGVSATCRLIVELNAVACAGSASRGGGSGGGGGSLLEPDYTCRLACFNRVNCALVQLAHPQQQQQQQQHDGVGEGGGAVVVDLTCLSALAHNCIWLLQHEDDMALRDNAVNTLEQMLLMTGRLMSPAGCEPPAAAAATAAELFFGCILPVLRVRLRAACDQLRHICVRLLRVAVLHCSGHVTDTSASAVVTISGQRKISQLLPLCNTVDDEQDFFLNVAHIQVARRGRAFKRLLSELSAGDLVISADVFTNYLLPLANVYLFNDKYRKHTALIDNAIKLVGVASSMMTWHQYQLLLRHYLRILPTCAIPRHAVRLVIAVLDNFPFRLAGSVDETEDTDAVMLNTIERKPADAAIDQSVPASAAGGRHHRQSAHIIKQLETTILPNLLLVLRATTIEPIAASTTTAAAATDSKSSGGGSGGQSGEEERVVRVPLAVAVVKLLLHLPPALRHHYVPSVLGTVCELLMSRAERCRAAALDALTSCVQQLFTTSSCSSSSSTSTANPPAAAAAGGGASVSWQLSAILDQLRGYLTRGFQLHVLLHTVGQLLAGVSRALIGQSSAAAVAVTEWRAQLAECADLVMQLGHMELFELRCNTATATATITAGCTGRGNKFERVPEARGVKIYSLLLLLSRNATESSLYSIVKHLARWTAECRSAQASAAVRECCRQCQIGVSENPHLTPCHLLLLCHALISHKITASSAAAAAAAPTDCTTGGGAKPVFTRVDCRLVPAEPKRCGKLETSVNDHILLEFGLSLLASVLRKQNSTRNNNNNTSSNSSNSRGGGGGKEVGCTRVSADLAAMITPLVPLLTSFLQHSDVKLVSECLQCWLALMKLRVPVSDTHVHQLRDTVFVTLHNYASTTTAVDSLHTDNLQLLVSVFKVITCLVRDMTTLRLTVDQLRLLLLHIEHNLLASCDPARRPARPLAASSDDAKTGVYWRRRLQRHLLALLSAILVRRFDAPELQQLVQLVARAAIQLADGSTGAITTKSADSGGGGGGGGCYDNCGETSSQTRALLLRYLLDYPLSRPQLERHVTFVLQQLSYPLVDGRRAALHICADICRKFPQSCLDNLCSVLFIYLAARLVNETDTRCRHLVAATVTSLVARISPASAHQLLDMCDKWLQQTASDKIEQVSMSALLLGSVFFSSAIDAKLPATHCSRLLSSLCHCATLSLADQCSVNKLNARDLQLYQLLTAVRKLFVLRPQLMVCSQCPSDTVDQLWDAVPLSLCHQHVWVRVAGAELLGQLLTSLDLSQLATALATAAAAAATTNSPTHWDTAAAAAAAQDEVLLPLPFRRRGSLHFVRKLSLDLCQQLTTQPLPEKLATQCIKNLIWIARLLLSAGLIVTDTAPPAAAAAAVPVCRPPLAPPRGRHGDDVIGAPQMSLDWLLRRLCRCVNSEVRAVSTGVLTSSSSYAAAAAGDDEDLATTSCRTAVFRWIAALVSTAAAADGEDGAAGEGGVHVLGPLLTTMVRPLARELSSNSGCPLTLRQLAEEVCQMLKTAFGVEQYTAALVEAQRKSALKKNKLKLQRASELVTNPTKSAQLKIKRNLKKNDTRKRKLAKIKAVGFKRRRVEML